MERRVRGLRRRPRGVLAPFGAPGPRGPSPHLPRPRPRPARRSAQTYLPSSSSSRRSSRTSVLRWGRGRGTPPSPLAPPAPQARPHGPHGALAAPAPVRASCGRRLHPPGPGPAPPGPGPSAAPPARPDTGGGGGGCVSRSSRPGRRGLVWRQRGAGVARDRRSPLQTST